MPKKRKDDRAPVDIAYGLLREGGAPMTARALLTEALGATGKDAKDGDLLAELQTEISLDHRFQPAPQGSWGLYEWAPKPKTRAKTTRKRGAASGASSDDDASDDATDE